MNGSAWKEYLTFSRKERTGILVLLGLIGIIYAVPEFLPEKRSVELIYNRDSLQQLPTLQNTQDHQLPGGPDSSSHDQRAMAITKPVRFAFDPNTLEEAGWQRLGVSEKTIRTIQNFRSKGGKFRMPSDLRKIYGMNKNICEELIPFVRIQNISGTSRRNGFKDYKDSNHYPEVSGNSYQDNKGFDSGNKPNIRDLPYKERTAPIRSVDINLADSAAWEQLPAIGSKLASRIILFRERLGGFYNVRQVAETFGITDSAFRIILPYLTNFEIAVRKININQATAPELARHPYIRWTIANAILNYRNQHGTFMQIHELKTISIISPEVFEKLEPYLTVQ